MYLKTNYIDERGASMLVAMLENAGIVLDKYGYTVDDIVNLCGGIPSPLTEHITVTITATFASAISVTIKTGLYEVSRNMDFSIGRIDNNFMHVYEGGQGLGTNLFLTQVATARALGFTKLHTIAMAPEEDNPGWYGYYFWANMGFENTDTDEYLTWAADFGREEPTLSELMQSAEGRDLWKAHGFAWIGNFYLEDNHPCMAYLRNHLQRKGIEVDL